MLDPLTSRFSCCRHVSKKISWGNKEIPVYAYYGVHTARALDNFMVSGVPISHFPRFIIALARKWLIR